MKKARWIVAAVLCAVFWLLVYFDFANGGRFFGDILRSLGF
jgi:hypothetical protein